LYDPLGPIRPLIHFTWMKSGGESYGNPTQKSTDRSMSFSRRCQAFLCVSLLYDIFTFLWNPSIRTLATSGLVNSGGGVRPLCSILRTWVPDKVTCSSSPCGQVFNEDILSHFL